jgi:hypothetical protein
MRLASMMGLMLEEMHNKDAGRCPHLATDGHAEPYLILLKPPVLDAPGEG